MPIANCTMKILMSIFIFILISTGFSQISPDSSRKEQERIINLSKYQSIDYFETARSLKIPARRGDEVVLQDEERKLYFGIIDTVRSLASIQIVLYPRPDRRELVQATYDDLYYLRNRPETAKSQSIEKNTAAVKDAVEKTAFSDKETSSQTDSDLDFRLAKLERKTEQQQLRINEAAFALESAGRSYETAEILRIVSGACLVLGSVFSSVGSFTNSSSTVATGGLLFLSSGISSVGALVYRFKGHGKIKSAGLMLRR